MKVGIFGLTGCAGDQLALLNCEDELLRIAGRVTLASFTMASSAGRGETEGDFDVAFVEGSVCQQRDKELLMSIRARSEKLVALGTCACFGGLPAMSAEIGAELLGEMVYGKEGSALVPAFRAQPLSVFVKVDFDLAGCPVEKTQLFETLACLLKGSFPELPPVPVCAECRQKENLCLVVERREICCGPMTRAGCGARCPSLSVVCRGCHGPLPDAYLGPPREKAANEGISRDEVRKNLLLFSTPAALEASLDKERE